LAFDECTSHYMIIIIQKMLWKEHTDGQKDVSRLINRTGIIRNSTGGAFKDLRLKSCKFISSLNFKGVAIGGSLENQKRTCIRLLIGVSKSSRKQAYSSTWHRWN